MAPQPLISFQDASDAANLNPNALYAVYYADGDTANLAAVRKRCPKAALFGITTTGATGKGIFALDCETGNLGASSNAELIAKADAWCAEQIKLGVDPIAVYANNNLWVTVGLRAALAKYGNRIKRWDADWNGNPSSMPSWADADQYADPGGVDLDVALASFFQPSIKPAPAVRQASVEVQVTVPEGTTGKLNVLLTFDAGAGVWTHHAVPGDPHWSGPGGGQWRTHPLEWNAPPLGA